MENESKLVVFSAPSGSGKSTIVNELLKQELPLAFSVSATSRPPRQTEEDGVAYYFLTPEQFREKIARGDFLEYEEVYKDRYYGTLKSEVEQILQQGNSVIFDVDVVGACNIKKHYGNRALTVFIQPPSIDVLKQRLEKRGTDAPDVIRERLDKAARELDFAPAFDKIIINDDLETACAEAFNLVRSFLSSTTVSHS
ncbi:MAG: guanylate kinase [Dysgonamonadaceae bacterium]|nr:guanylate kinase [Dysgonamonadaceae bacterium]